VPFLYHGLKTGKKMKILNLILGCLLPLAVLAGPKQTVKIKTSAICEMCKERIEKNLTLSKGVKKADLDLNDKVIHITYDAGKTDVEALKKAITEVGYDADDAKAEPKGYDKLPSCCKKGSASAAHH